MNTKSKPQNEAQNMNMSFKQFRILNGLLLGKGQVNGARNVIRSRAIEKQYASWLANVFSSIGGRCIQDGNDMWAFETGRMDWVSNWRKRWYYKNKKVIPAKLSLSPEMAGVWYHDKGSQESHSRIKFNFQSMYDSLHNGKELLERAEFSPYESQGSLWLSEWESDEFLDWIQEPDY